MKVNSALNSLLLYSKVSLYGLYNKCKTESFHTQYLESQNENKIFRSFVRNEKYIAANHY